MFSHAFAWTRLLVGPLRERLEGRGGVKAAMANSSWLLFDKLARAFLGLLVGAWVARYLGPVQYGLLAYVIAFIALFQALANLGADAIVVRDIAQKPGDANEILGTALALRLVAGAVCWIAVIGFVAYSNPGSLRTVTMAAIVGGTLVFQAADTVDLWFQSQSQSRRTVVAKLFAYLLSSGGKVAMILAGAPLPAFAALTAFDALAGAAGLAIAYRRMPTSHRWRFSPTCARRLLKEAWPFMLSGMSIMVYYRIDQVMVKELLGDRAVGIYAAALPLSQFWQVIPLTLATSLAPFIARRKLADERDYRRTLVVTFRLFFYTGLATTALTWLVAGELVAHLFGAQFQEASLVLKIHALSNVFCFLGIAHSLWLTNEGRFAVRLYGTVLAGLTTVAMNYVLLPRIGVIGAAYTAIAAQFVAAWLINLFLDPESFRMQWQAVLFRKT